MSAATEDQAVFYKQTALRGLFPITELIPNEETQEAIRKARASEDLVTVGQRRRSDGGVRECASSSSDEV